jgi:class 3 adenylate cyclase
VRGGRRIWPRPRRIAFSRQDIVGLLLVRLQFDCGTNDATDGERKTVTALFADIKGSMDLMETLDVQYSGRAAR